MIPQASGRSFFRLLTAAALLVAAAPFAVAGEETKAPALKVEPDLRVELMSLIFRLAGNPEYNQGRVELYTREVESHFGDFRDHPVVLEARKLRASRGVSYDAVMSMAIHLKDPFSLAERVPLDPRPETLDKRWRPREARAFLKMARRFVRETGFEGFVKKREGLFRLAADRLRGILEKEAHLEWFETFFGSRPGAGFTATFGLLNGGGCYGTRIRLPGGREELYSLLGVWKTDASGKPDFDASVVDTLIHEFTHSYANPLMDGAADRLEKPASTLYGFVGDAMRRQAYGSWGTMMRESLVRACVVRYLHTHQGPAAAAKQARAEGKRSFFWVKDLAALLAKYEADRKTYPDLQAFVPRIVEFFEAYAPRFVEARRGRAEKTPMVVSMTPKNGATDVNPAVECITVVFDRPMADGGWAMVGGGPNFPEITGKPSYDKTCTIWTVAVKLKPDWDYYFWLNRGKYNSFRSRDGVPLESVRVSFRTGARR